jgi:hypothetical protein
MSDDIPYEEKLRAYAAYQHDRDPDYFAEDGSFLVHGQPPDEGGDWVPVGQIKPDPAKVERWWALTHTKN